MSEEQEMRELQLMCRASGAHWVAWEGLSWRELYSCHRAGTSLPTSSGTWCHDTGWLQHVLGLRCSLGRA